MPQEPPPPPPVPKKRMPWLAKGCLGCLGVGLVGFLGLILAVRFFGPGSQPKDYFPEIYEGSEQSFIFKIDQKSIPFISLKSSVVHKFESSKTINGKKYFRRVQIGENGDSTFGGFWHKSPEGVFLISEEDGSGPETLLFPLPLTVGSTWTANGMDFLAEGFSTLEINGETYYDCLKIVGERPGYRTVVFRKSGVGLIQEVSDGSQRISLERLPPAEPVDSIADSDVEPPTPSPPTETETETKEDPVVGIWTGEDPEMRWSIERSADGSLRATEVILDPLEKTYKIEEATGTWRREGDLVIEETKLPREEESDTVTWSVVKVTDSEFHYRMIEDGEESSGEPIIERRLSDYVLPSPPRDYREVDIQHEVSAAGVSLSFSLGSSWREVASGNEAKFQNPQNREISVTLFPDGIDGAMTYEKAVDLYQKLSSETPSWYATDTIVVGDREGFYVAMWVGGSSSVWEHAFVELNDRLWVVAHIDPESTVEDVHGKTPEFVEFLGGIEIDPPSAGADSPVTKAALPDFKRELSANQWTFQEHFESGDSTFWYFTTQLSVDEIEGTVPAILGNEWSIYYPETDEASYYASKLGVMHDLGSEMRMYCLELWVIHGPGNSLIYLSVFTEKGKDPTEEGIEKTVRIEHVVR